MPLPAISPTIAMISDATAITASAGLWNGHRHRHGALASRFDDA